MRYYLAIFGRVAGVAGIVFFVLAFTPMDIVPLLFSMPLEFGSPGAIFLLFWFVGAPAGFYLHALLTTHKDDWLPLYSAITGFWTGSVGGSFLGLKTTGVL